MAAGAAAAAPARAAVGGSTLWVYDRSAAIHTALLPDDAIAIEGDRVRLARQLLARKPHEIRGITRYADFLLLSGAAAEQGYRVVQRDVLDGDALSWSVRRR